MAQSLRLVAGVDSAAGPRAAAVQPVNERRRAQSPDTDWHLARHTKVNVMLVGAEGIAHDLVVSLWRQFEGPVMVRRRGERLRLSPTSEPVGTLVLHGVDTLTPQDQHTLNHWLDARGARTRVVSTASPGLLPMLESQEFSEQLYFRLNTVCIELRAV